MVLEEKSGYPQDSTCSCYVLLLWCPGRIHLPTCPDASNGSVGQGSDRPSAPLGGRPVSESARALPSRRAATFLPPQVHLSKPRSVAARREEGLKDVGGLNAEIRTGHPAAAPRPTPYLPGIPGAKVVFQRRRPRMSGLRACHAPAYLHFRCESSPPAGPHANQAGRTRRRRPAIGKPRKSFGFFLDLRSCCLWISQPV